MPAKISGMSASVAAKPMPLSYQSTPAVSPRGESGARIPSTRPCKSISGPP
jgi:hypothetical protein